MNRLPVDQFAPSATRFTYTCDPAIDLVNLHNFGILIRGAVGRKLHSFACNDAREGRECLHPLPCAYQIWKNGMSGATKGLSINPYTIEWDVDERGLYIHIRLFGDMQKYAREVYVAGKEALEFLYNSSNKSPERQNKLATLKLKYSSISEEKFEQTEFSPIVQIRFLTPVRIKSGSHHSFDINSLISGIANRANLIANLHGYEIEFDVKELLAARETLVILEHELMDVSWARKPRTTKQSQAITESGTLGFLVLAGLEPLVFDLLSLGSFIHVGASTTAGFGRMALDRPA